MNAWMYRGSPFTSDQIGSMIGFVYVIVNILDQRSYIGKKLFWFNHIKTVKGKRKRIKVESDWMKYWSSSIELQEDVAHFGEHNFTREILHLCSSKGVMSYLEMREQLANDVLLKPLQYYNGFVGGKIHRNHVRTMFLEG